MVGTSASIDGDITNNIGGADYWCVKLDNIGNLLWQKSFGGSAEDQATCIKQTSDGGFVISGFSTSNDNDVTGNNGSRDYWILKLAPELLSTNDIKFSNNLNIYPNPSNQNIIVQNDDKYLENFNYKIIDLTGRIVKNGNSKFNEQINIENLTSGNYIIQIETENGERFTEKLIKN